MKQLFNPLFNDFIISIKKIIKSGTKPVETEGAKIYQFVATVDEIIFFFPNGRDEWGNVVGGYGKMSIDKREILALADKIKEIEATSIPDGTYEDSDDLPF